MSESFTVHPGAEELMRLVSGELSGDQEADLRQHLAVCSPCAAALERVAEAWAGYLAYQMHHLKPSVPPPPKQWLTPEELIAVQPRRISRRVLSWAAVAAGLLVAVIAYQQFRRPPVVSAAGLLTKAAALEQRKPRTGRIRIRTRRASFVRAAVAPLRPNATLERELEARFTAAHYSWDDPLSAGTFARWRSQLAQKRDDVSLAESTYRIRTSTPTGPLMEATLSLRAGDLHPVEGELKFRDETVLITEIPDALPTAAPAVPAPLIVPAPEPSATIIGPGEELRAVAALHTIGADLGEPIEVTRGEHEIVISAAGLTPERELEVRESLAHVPGAVVRTEGGGVPRKPTETGLRNPADELANQILEASDSALARAFALASLAQRFPAVIEGSLSGSGRALLAGIRTDHLRALETALGRVDSLVKTAWPEAAGSSAESASPESILDSAQRLDHLLNRAFAGGPAPPKAEVIAALRQFQARVGRR